MRATARRSGTATTSEPAAGTSGASWNLGQGTGVEGLKEGGGARAHRGCVAGVEEAERVLPATNLTSVTTGTEDDYEPDSREVVVFGDDGVLGKTRRRPGGQPDKEAQVGVSVGHG